MRIFLACLGTETNTFSPLPTGLASFAETLLCHGDGSTRGRHVLVEPIRLWRRLAEAKGYDVVESLSAFAEPAGLTVRTVHHSLRDEILSDLTAAGPVDMVLLSLHGAMAAEGCLDVEGDLLQRIREITGPRTIVGAELDLHCHLTDAMLGSATAMVIYKEYPHIDVTDRAAELFRICDDAAASGRVPRMTCRRCDINAYMGTTSQPMRGFVDRMSALEGRDGILSVSLAHGFPHGDVPGAGTGVLIVSEPDASGATHLAEALAADLWAMRERLRPDYRSIDDAIDEALAVPSAPVVIADASDNAGVGAASDATFFLRRLLQREVRSVVNAVYWDPIAVRLCEEAGEGASFDLRLGGKCSPASGDPLDVRAKVMRILPDASQTFNGFPMPMGTLVWIRVDDIDILLNTRRFQVGHPDLMRNIGLDPMQRRILVVKSTQHFHFGFAPIAAKVIYSAGPGTTNPDTSLIRYTNARQPGWPPLREQQST